MHEISSFQPVPEIVPATPRAPLHIAWLMSTSAPLSEVLVELLRHDATSWAPRQSGPTGDQLPLALDDDDQESGGVSDKELAPDEVAVAYQIGAAFDQRRDALVELTDSVSVTVIEVAHPSLVGITGRLVRKLLLPPKCSIINAEKLDAGLKLGPGAVALFAREGKRGETPDTGNDTVTAAIQRRCSIIGIAADPHRVLPRSLMRLVDHQVSVPGIDGTTIAAVIAAVTGRSPGAVDPALAQKATLEDLTLAVRADLTPRRCLERLRKIVAAGGAQTSAPRLSQLHGLDAARDWGLDLVRDLHDYRAGRLPWSAVDRGVVLAGPPGTGKTTFARALAQEAGVHFIATSYAEWQSYKDGHLGSVTQAIRNSFAEAVQRRPAIIFIDEIDTIPARGSTTRNDDWWTAITTTLLEALDGADRREGVVVIGACNHPDRLDPALVRPGRLDRLVFIPLPDAAALAGIFRHHLGADLESVDLMPAAAAARGGTGANVEQWVRQARRVARRAQRPLALDDLLAAINEGQSALTAEDRRRMAYHEAGHAIALIALSAGKPVSMAIGSGGGVFESTKDDLKLATREQLEVLIVCRMAGRAAEQLVFGAVSQGAGGDVRSDLAQATHLALLIETAFGLGSLGPVWIGAPDSRDLLLFQDLRHAVETTIARAGDEAIKILSAHRDALDALANALLERGYLDEAEITSLAGPIRPRTAPLV